MEDQYVAHGAVHRRGHSDLQAKIDHAAGEPADLERFAALQVVVHGCGHFRRPAVEERNALLGVVRGQLHSMGTANGDHLAREIKQEFPCKRVGTNRPNGAAHGGGGAGHRNQHHVLLPDRATDIVADLGIDAAPLAGLVERLDTRRMAAVVFAENQALQRARLGNDSRPTDIGADIGDAAHERLVTEDRPQHVVLLYPVLKRDDAGLRLHDRQELPGRVLGVPQLDAEHHQIDRTDGLRVVSHVHAGKVDGLRPAFDREAALAHGREVAAARHKMNVRTALGEPGSEIAPDASRTHDGNAQGSLL